MAIDRDEHRRWFNEAEAAVFRRGGNVQPRPMLPLPDQLSDQPVVTNDATQTMMILYGILNEVSAIRELLEKMVEQSVDDGK